MSRPANKTTGKAVADIKALYFLKHQNGAEPSIVESLDSADWFPVLTLRGTVTAGQDAPSLEKINVDQFDAPIGITTEPGDFNFEAQMPAVTYADLSKWLAPEDIQQIVDDNEAPVTINGRKLVGLNLNGDIYEVSVLIQTRTNDTFVFSNAQISVTFSKEDKVFLFRVSGQILAASNPDNFTMYFATESAASSSNSETPAVNPGTGS